MTTDLAIARAATLRPIAEIAARAGIPEEALEPHGRFKAKLDPARIPNSGRTGALVLVTGISPTAAGEGKTTTTIGLGDALNALGTKAMICLREPSLGPCFGVKGGATGGGRAQVAPMEGINLHFTGDFHAITSANNLLSAMVDNHIHWGNALGLDQRRVTWRRAIDMNDRALRDVLVGLGGMPNGLPREDGFDITVASEVMAILCLARDLEDLQERLGRIIVGQRRDGSSVTAADIKAHGAMAALLREAMFPNLVQTLEGSPALVHGGPFANIAHGCNSVAATRLGLRLADVVVTEAGFGADLGGEKFCDIKCRLAELAPSACVVVATVRALKLHGGVVRANLDHEDVAAVRRGAVNLQRHVENMRLFGLPVVVALNEFTSDTEAEFAVVREAMAPLGAEVVLCTHWADGAAGATELARAVTRLIEGGTARFAPIYPDAMPLEDKVRSIARKIYRASEVNFPPAVHARLKRFEEAGYGHFPVCIAKTQYSFSADPALLGAPTGHVLPVREVRLSAGAGFIVVICGEVMTMPGLPRSPAAERIHLDAEGRIEGLF
ncbi:MAG: formate--tetrahydrofolate ligase [Azospirillum brasilense]|nr:MAG: formate--tetrahydrofolate ligase [Azospirillum brasilense]